MMKEKKESIDVSKRIIRPIFIIILLMFVITSGALGFVLGRRAAGESLGAQLDTIPLIPPQSANPDDMGDEITHFLSARIQSLTGEYLRSSGDVTDAGGKLLPNVVLKLGSKAEEKSDSEGVFRFSDIQTGTYTLKAVDSDKHIIAGTEITFDFNESREVKIEVSEAGLPVVTLPDNTRMLELTVELDGDKMNINEESSYVTTADYELITFDDKALAMSSEGFTITPSGNLIAPEGFIVFPESKEAITPDGYIEKQSISNVIAPMMTITEDEKIETDGGFTINPDSSVDDGETILYPEKNAPIIIEENEAEKVEIEEDYVPEPATPSPKPTDNPASEEDESSGSETEEPDTSDVESGGISDESENDNPTPEPGPSEPDSFIAESVDGGVRWQQQTAVDLFKNRVDRGRTVSKTVQIADDDDGRIKEVPVIEPGAHGYYRFRIINDNDFAVEYQMRISEVTFHLPLRYSLYRDNDNFNYMYGATVDTDMALTSLISIQPHSEIIYRLEWEWPYDALDWRGRAENDKQDLLYAEMSDREYMVSLDIAATQKEESRFGDDTRYQGERK